MGGGKHAETSFWKLLKAQAAGANTLGDITQQGTKLQGELNEWNNPQGDVLVEATPFGGGAHGWQLNIRDHGSGPSFETVYWLPWKDGEATSVKRKTSEKTSNFFMTTALTGCDFTATADIIAHTAFSAGGQGHKESRTGGKPGASSVFNLHRQLVFGWKLHTGAWTYRVWLSHPPPGTWTVLI